MTLPRSARLAACFALLFAIVTAAAPAADPAEVKKWDVTRTTVPEDLAELKALQTTVKEVVEKCTPATVAVLNGPSAGSGVIVSEDGLVLTAAHVIRDYAAPKKGGLEGKALPFTAGRSIKVMLPDGKRVNAKTLGINEGKDSGMVQITDKGPNNGKWPFLPVGKSGDLAKGQWVVALGHPSGPKVGRTVVARLGRIQSTSKSIVSTDCTLVGGDSGGPLFDLNGNVVGIHSRIGLTLWQNIHVQTDTFKRDWDKMVAGEWVDKPASAKTSTAAYFGVVFPDDEEEDAWLKEVESDGPAGKAGLRPGDTIMKCNDSVVKSVKQFRKFLEGAKPGDKVNITYRRDTNVKSVPVTLAKRA